MKVGWDSSYIIHSVLAHQFRAFEYVNANGNCSQLKECSNAVIFCLVCYSQVMNIDKMTSLQPSEYAFVLDPSMPVLAKSMEIGKSHRVAAHVHPRAQLLYAIQGVLRVNTLVGTWVVPPSQAVWLPSGMQHETICRDSTSLRTLYIDPSYTDSLPQDCCVANVTNLLKELILKAVAIDNIYQPDTPQWRVMQVILDELADLQQTPLSLPLPADKRLMPVVEHLLQNPSDNRGLDYWAKESGASSRTLARLFMKQTGLNFSEWRMQLRLLEAVERLSQGESVTRLAFELGYNSPSAFINMFRKVMGVAPGKYVKSG